MAKREQFVSPRGVFKYCHLNKPDVKGAERFGGAEQYKVTLLLEKDAPGVEAFLAKLEKLHQAALEAGVEAMDEATPKAKAAWKKKKISEPNLNPFYDDEVDEDGEPTGRIELRFKTHAAFTDKKTGEEVKKTVPFIDGKGKTIPWKKRPLVYGGTEGKIAFATSNVFIPKDADVYLGFYLNSVQLLKLSTGGDSNPFGEEEDSEVDSDELDEYEGNAGGGSKSKDDEDLDEDLDGDGGSDDDDEIDDEIPF